MSGLVEEPVPNLPLLRKVLDHVDSHPEEWKQSMWGTAAQNPDVTACATAFCIAGHAAVMTGHSLLWEANGPDEWRAYYTVDGQFVGNVAQAELGLTDYERDSLFSSGNDRSEVQEAAESIAARVGEVL